MQFIHLWRATFGIGRISAPELNAFGQLRNSSNWELSRETRRALRDILTEKLKKCLKN